MDNGSALSPTARILDTDTMVLRLAVGDRVRCRFGDYEGLYGVVESLVAGARVLIRIGHGHYLELPRICVQHASPARCR
jgi:hypothetical protein